MKIVFQVGSVNISGGTYVIFEHATRIKKAGHEVYILTEEKVVEKDISWHIDAHILEYITYEELEHKVFDIAIATWWKTVFLIHRINAKQYLYFVQSIESKFYPDQERALRHLVESTYTLNFPVITEATWIKHYLEEHYYCDVELVRNGIRKDLYHQKVTPIAPRRKNKVRILVEGPLGVPFKNVERTIALCKESDADEIWLMTSSPVSSYKDVDRVFSQVPIDEAAKVYSSCDVVVKLSYVEGMFGPPLEMFHCGGTAIVYDVTGHDEYIVDQYNALVVKRDDEAGVVSAINRLVYDRAYLEELKRHALETAAKWKDWGASSALFLKKLDALHKLSNKVDSKRVGMLTRFHEESYVIAETSVQKKRILEQIRLFKIKIKNRYPEKYAKLKTYYYKVFKKPLQRY